MVMIYHQYKCVKGNSGFTLIEAVVTISVLSVVTYFILQVMSSFNQYTSSMSVAESVETVLLQNLTEINSRTSATIPNPGKCVARFYDFANVLKQTLIDDSASPTCLDDPQDNEIKVFWKILPATATNFTFNNASMKLPTHNPTNLKVIDVEVRAKKSVSNINSRLSVRVYRN